MLLVLVLKLLLALFGSPRRVDAPPAVGIEGEVGEGGGNVDDGGKVRHCDYGIFDQPEWSLAE